MIDKRVAEQKSQWPPIKIIQVYCVNRDGERVLIETAYLGKGHAKFKKENNDKKNKLAENPNS